MRPKPVMARQIGLSAGQKADAANQTKPQTVNPQQQLASNNKLVFIIISLLHNFVIHTLSYFRIILLYHT